jgi:hypothetical protein
VTAGQIAAVIRDIDATILYWRNTGVLVAMVAQQLRCSNNWAVVRARMIEYGVAQAKPRRLAA